MHALLGRLLLKELLHSVTCIIEHHLVRLKDLTLSVENANKLGNEIYLLPQISFISSDFSYQLRPLLSTLGRHPVLPSPLPLASLSRNNRARHGLKLDTGVTLCFPSV